MKNNMTARTGFIVFLVAVVLVWIIGSNRTPAQHPNAQENAANDFLAVRDALRHGGLREAAKLKGHYVGDFDPHLDNGHFDLEALTKYSVVVITGTVVKQVGTRLSDEDQLVMTDYEVIVTETMKGSPLKGDSVTISLLGGRIEFDDGTSAEIRTPNSEHVKPNGPYLFFLGESQSAPNVYSLTGGPQGLVEIMTDGGLKSHGRTTDPVALEAQDPNTGKNKDSFIRAVRKAVVKWPGPGSCCFR